MILSPPFLRGSPLLIKDVGPFCFHSHSPVESKHVLPKLIAPLNQIASSTDFFSLEQNSLKEWFFKHQTALEGWFADAFKLHPALPYLSVDIRDAGYKCAPVDTNLFPAGFNNLTADSIQEASTAFHHLWPTPQNILLIPENHTRNQHYLKNIICLKNALEQAEHQVNIGSVISDLKKPFTIDIDKESLTLQPLNMFPELLENADVILLNHDLSEGIPSLLDNYQNKMVPHPQLGWHERLKSNHFKHYQDLVYELSSHIRIDPWFLNPNFQICDQLDLKTSEGEKCLMRQVEAVLNATDAGLQQHHVDQTPFVIIKADSGTYGMAVMSAHSPNDVHQLNRKQRMKMSTSKGNRTVKQAIVQEGIPSTNQYKNHVAEPVIYMVGQTLVGAFWRYHPDRCSTQNLNTPGMVFEPIALSERQCLRDPNWYLYWCIARLANLAAARELLEKS